MRLTLKKGVFDETRDGNDNGKTLSSRSSLGKGYIWVVRACTIQYLEPGAERSCIRLFPAPWQSLH